jgi:hypothetical protein
MHREVCDAVGGEWRQCRSGLQLQDCLVCAAADSEDVFRADSCHFPSEDVAPRYSLRDPLIAAFASLITSEIGFLDDIGDVAPPATL